MAEPPEPAERNIEVDEADDHDSVFSDDMSAFTASITSSILDYPVENGRRYHAFRSGVYCLPNDELEQDRLDLSHALMTKGIGDKLFLAPIDTKKMHRVLDIGTGTGIWSMAMGDEYPNAEAWWPTTSILATIQSGPHEFTLIVQQILGNDLSAIQPPWVPPNVKFEIDDVECGWIYEAPFDFIFCRYMAAGIKDWPKLVESVYDNLVPGGWAEFQDFNLQYYSEDDTLPADSNTLTWINTLLDAAHKTGRDPCPGPRLEEWVRDAGFQGVTHQKFRFPIGSRPKDRHMKDLGMFNLMQVLSGLEGFSLRLFCHVLGWKKEEVLVLLAGVRNELKGSGMHVQFDFHVVYGQKKKDAVEER